MAAASGVPGAAKAATPVTVSSLQQLLALKNRVLMALQQHGIAKQTRTAGAPNGASAGAPAVQGHTPAQAGGANAGAAGGQLELTPVAMGVLVAIVVLVLALFVGLLTRKRRKPAEPAPEAPATSEPTLAAASAAAPAAEPVAPAEAQPRVNEAVPPEPVEPEPTNEVTVTPVPTPEISSEPLERDATLGDAASVEAAAGLGAEALPPTLTEPLQPAAPQEPPPVAEQAASLEAHPHDVEPTEPQTPADTTEAASLAAAAELGAEALPPESLAAAPHAAEDTDAPTPTLEELPRTHEPTTPEAAPDFANDAPQASQAEPSIAHPPHETEASAQPPETPPVEPQIPAVPAEDMKYAEVPSDFPHDAVEALGSIGLPLPPRIGEPLSTEPVATPEASARLSTPFDEPPAPKAGEAIEAGTAGAGALAGLGAARFGTLTLDFDLNLPPDSAEPLPVFTPEQLARIARNKLDLAHEYIALGDVAGARSLINEVIESNDHATRSDAQTLLSTLAPLS